MSSEREVLDTTTSLCPTCLDRVPGEYTARDGGVHLRRTCPDHGVSSRKVWGSVDHWEWAGDLGPAFESTVGADERLTVDNDHACLAVVEVTSDCNLSCSYCFASSGPGGQHRPFEEVVELLEVVKSGGGPRPIQFSGGEPTVRDDLPELVARATEMGFDHVQVNTNGLRLASEAGYAARLAEAGVTAVYLQFDGLEPETYEAIREVDIAGEKRAAVAACREAGLQVVLVPTVVPGVNDHEMGAIVEFGLEHRDVVSSINFQPVAHFGRYAEHDGRFALDDAARTLAAQVEALEPRDVYPVPCCSSYCQMTTALLPGADDEEPIPLTGLVEDEAFANISGVVDESDWMELLAGTPAGGERACSAAGCCGVEVPAGADELLDEVLPISITGFMDADAADVDRLGNCCISVPTPDGELVPFCGYNMTTDDGAYALRNRYDWGGRPGVDAPLPDPPDAAADPDVDGGDPPGDGPETGTGGAGSLDDSGAPGEAASGGGCCCGPSADGCGTGGMEAAGPDGGSDSTGPDGASGTSAPDGDGGR